MSELDKIREYFPAVSDGQMEQFETMARLYPEWNEKINVISRKDIDNLVVNHILHSLVIGKFLGVLSPGTSFIDLGTGGGFPGIPLAALYPECTFHLIDRIGKKLRVAADIAEKAGLTNVTFQHGDAGECHDKFDYMVSRAVMPLDGLVKIAARNIKAASPAGNRYSNGLICLKGGDLSAEIAAVRLPVMEYTVREIINDPAYDGKELIYVPITKK